MKVTVAFFGIPRCTAVSAPSIEHHILRPLREVADVSVVYHLWHIDRVISNRSGENAALTEDSYAYFKNFKGLIERPDAFEGSELFQTWKSFGDEFHGNYGSLRNLMHQLQSLKRVTAMAERDDPDIVIFARPDLLYHDDIPLSACRLAANFPRLCVVPNWHWFAGYNDRFAICGRKTFRTYGNRLERAVDYARSARRPIHSESLLKFAMRRSSALTLSIPTTASRVRVDSTVVNESFDGLSTSVLWRGRIDRLHRLQWRWVQGLSRMIFTDAAWDHR